MLVVYIFGSLIYNESELRLDSIGGILMALIQCPVCDNKISRESETCIYCGHPIKKSWHFILSIVLIFAIIIVVILIVVGILFIKEPAEQANTSIIDMQAITLTITGAAVSMVCIITTLLNFDRERRQREYEKEQERKFDSYREKLNQRVNERINQLSTIASENKRAFEEQMKEYSDIKNEFRQNIQVFLDVSDSEEASLDLRISKYEDSFQKNPSNTILGIALIDLLQKKVEISHHEMQIRLNKRITELAGGLIQNNKLSELQMISLKLKKANAHYLNTKLLVNTKKEEAQKNINEALSIYNDLNDVRYGLNSNVFILEALGLSCFWYYQTVGKSAVAWLKYSTEYYNQARQTSGNELNARLHNSLAVSEHNEARLIPDANARCSKLLQVKTHYKYAIELAPSRPKPWLNVASINIDIIKTRLGLDGDERSECEKALTFDHITDEVKKEIDTLYEEACFNLKQANQLAPTFIDNHYKFAQLYMFYALAIFRNSYGYEGCKYQLDKLIHYAKGKLRSAYAINPRNNAVIETNKCLEQIIGFVSGN